jgi:hypothetical protein
MPEKNQTSGPSASAAAQAMNIQRTDTAVVFIDPQNDVLSEKGANWEAVGASVTEEPNGREHGENLQGREDERI